MARYHQITLNNPPPKVTEYNTLKGVTFVTFLSFRSFVILRMTDSVNMRKKAIADKVTKTVTFVTFYRFFRYALRMRDVNISIINKYCQ